MVFDSKYKYRMPELDSSFPKINCEPLDIYALKNSFLVAIENVIIFGSPKFTKNEILLEENSYIKIQPTFYTYWKNALDAIGAKLASNDYNDIIDEIIVTYLTFKIIWKYQNRVVFFQILNHSENKTILAIDEIDFYNIYRGICELFFKPFCIPAFIHYTFKVCTETLSLKEISKINNIQDALILVKKLNLVENNFSDLYLAAENILRFHSQIVVYKSFLKKSFKPYKYNS